MIGKYSVLKFTILFSFISTNIYAQSVGNIHGSVLLWNTLESDLDYTSTRRTKDVTDFTDTPLVGSKKYLDFNWDCGFRAGLDIRLPYLFSELRLTWTGISPTAHESISRFDDDEVLTISLIHPEIQVDVAGCKRVKGLARFDYHTFDFVLAGESCLFGGEISPYLGGRVLLFDQKISALYTDLINRDGEDIGSSVRSKMGTDLWAAGLHLGCSMASAKWSGWSFTINGAASLLTGDADAKIFHEALDRLFTDVKDSYCLTLPGCELSLGISHCLSFACAETELSLSYDFTYWHQVPKDIRYFSPNNNTLHASFKGNILLHGLTAQASLAF